MEGTTNTMLSRTHYASVVGRSAAMRRQRRRAHASDRLYCSTNGCASFLELDAEHGVATCPVCGLVRRLH